MPLPRPHSFTPPNLTLITDTGVQLHRTKLVGRYGVTLFGRTPSPSLVGVPRDTRGSTRVIYTQIDNYESSLPRHIYGEGRAFLHTPDVFSEAFGVRLATVRAVTHLIERWQPVNAADLGVRIGRYLDDIIDEHGETGEEEVILARAVDALSEAISKCPK